jgi:hypothetical protein
VSFKILFFNFYRTKSTGTIRIICLTKKRNENNLLVSFSKRKQTLFFYFKHTTNFSAHIQFAKKCLSHVHLLGPRSSFANHVPVRFVQRNFSFIQQNCLKVQTSAKINSAFLRKILLESVKILVQNVGQAVIVSSHNGNSENFVFSVNFRQR